jgi:hypothetical protein
MANCREFTLGVVWWPVTIIVHPSAISSHNQLILREIENNDSPGFDLGHCTIRYGDKQEKKFSHVFLRTGDNSMFTSNCYGCTLAVYLDGGVYEIVSVQKTVNN